MYLRIVRLCQWLYKKVQVLMPICDVMLKLRSNCSDILLGLAVCVRMVGSVCQVFWTGAIADGTEEFAFELASIIRQYVGGYVEWDDPMI